jgi:hypothetical protein
MYLTDPSHLHEDVRGLFEISPSKQTRQNLFRVSSFSLMEVGQGWLDFEPIISILVMFIIIRRYILDMVTI